MYAMLRCEVSSAMFAFKRIWRCSFEMGLARVREGGPFGGVRGADGFQRLVGTVRESFAKIRADGVSSRDVWWLGGLAALFAAHTHIHNHHTHTHADAARIADVDLPRGLANHVIRAYRDASAPACVHARIRANIDAHARAHMHAYCGLCLLSPVAFLSARALARACARSPHCVAWLGPRALLQSSVAAECASRGGRKIRHAGGAL